jgi:hypothetical protein
MSGGCRAFRVPSAPHLAAGRAAPHCRSARCPSSAAAAGVDAGLHPVPQRVGHDPQQELEGSGQELRRHVIICRLLELYKPVLITDRVEADADDATWAKTLSSSPRRFFAVTAAQRLRALVPRDVLTGAVVARLAAAMTRPDQGRTDQ